jgi:hypothetical protein
MALVFAAVAFADFAGADVVGFDTSVGDADTPLSALVVMPVASVVVGAVRFRRTARAGVGAAVPLDGVVGGCGNPRFFRCARFRAARACSFSSSKRSFLVNISFCA